METNTQTQEEKLALAKTQIEDERRFYSHLLTYVLVIAFLTALNLYNGGYFWVKWVMLGWGIGITSHAIGTFGSILSLGKKWEEKRLKKLMK